VPLRDITQRRDQYVNPNDDQLRPTDEEIKEAEVKEKKYIF